MANQLIFHIAFKEQWEGSKKTGQYHPGTFSADGFIHCSTSDQIQGVGQRLFKGKKGLVLLEIDEEKVRPEIKYEASGKGMPYPHIYGPLNVDAVLRARDFFIM